MTSKLIQIFEQLFESLERLKRWEKLDSKDIQRVKKVEEEIEELTNKKEVLRGQFEKIKQRIKSKIETTNWRFNGVETRSQEWFKKAKEVAISRDITALLLNG